MKVLTIYPERVPEVYEFENAAAFDKYLLQTMPHETKLVWFTPGIGVYLSETTGKPNEFVRDYARIRGAILPGTQVYGPAIFVVAFQGTESGNKATDLYFGTIIDVHRKHTVTSERAIPDKLGLIGLN